MLPSRCGEMKRAVFVGQYTLECVIEQHGRRGDGLFGLRVHHLSDDRAILRVGAYEVMVRTDVPSRSAINEYVELAHAFFSGTEPKLVNGVLDRIAQHHRAGDLARAPAGGDAQTG